MKLIKIEPNCVDATWPHVVEFIEKPLKRTQGEKDLNDVYQELLAGYLQLWVGADEEDGIFGICITQLITFPQYKTLAMPYIGTKPHTIHKWFDYGMSEDSPIIKFAREQGVKRLEGYARDGWLKFTPKYDFKKYTTVITREL
mgnify:FL=1